MPDEQTALHQNPETNEHTTVTARASGSAAAAVANGNGHPAGHGLRRARTTLDEAPAVSLRRPPTLGLGTSTPDSSREWLPRRSSNFSDISLKEARNILNPNGKVEEEEGQTITGSSSLASLSLAFAFLPAVAGVLFKNGSALVTDLMLLCLAAVFLHWSVTQPWSWYHSAQQVRILNQFEGSAMIDDEEDPRNTPRSPDSEAGADDKIVSTGNSSAPMASVPEEEEQVPIDAFASTRSTEYESRTADTERQVAESELYLYEVLALLSCFLLPLGAAYLLHAIRAQLSRPSEGLVSNYNLTIFLLISEIRVFSHLIKLLKSRTLYLQRIVQQDSSQSSSASSSKLGNVLERLEKLESRVSFEPLALQQQQEEIPASGPDRTRQEAGMIREVRNAIQPELDALNRAVRRYEKKATLLQMQTESRFSTMDSRLEDAIALAAVAAKQNIARKGVFVYTLEYALFVVLFPFNAVLQVLLFPLKGVLAMVYRGKRTQPAAARQSRSGRASKSHSQSQTQGRWNGDKVPARVAKR